MRLEVEDKLGLLPQLSWLIPSLLQSHQHLQQALVFYLPSKIIAVTPSSDPEKTAIESEGLQKLASDLGVDPISDISLFVFIYRCGIKQVGSISKEEFIKGMEACRADSIETLVSRLPEIRQLGVTTNNTDFRNFYKFAFEISKEPGSRVLDIEEAIALLNLLLKIHFQSTDKFVEYLQERELKGMTGDQFLGFLDLCNQYRDNFETYDPDDPWPVLIDEFVAWLKSK